MQLPARPTRVCRIRQAQLLAAELTQGFQQHVPRSAVARFADNDE
jgi:hypothetical protein